MHKQRRILIVTFLLTFALVLLVPTARAAQNSPDIRYVATWGNDSNDCRSWATACRTIRGAYERMGTEGVIRIGPGTYPEINTLGGRISLIGAGPNRTIVDGQKAGSVFTIFDGAHITIRNMTIRNGKGKDLDRGGGITNWGTLVLDHVIIQHNFSNWGAVGGISSSGTLTVTNSAVIDNTGPGNTGGILSTGNLYLENVTIARNHAPESGKAGALSMPGGARGTLINVTISGNTSFFGAGGIGLYGNLSLTNVTIAYNKIASPADKPVDLYVGGRVALRNTIILGECVGSGTITSQGYNIERGDTCNLTQSTDKKNTDPKLSPLAKNGGVGETHALPSGSPAIDAGNNATCPQTDQRGMGRWDGDGDGNKVCDVGAYEYMPAGVLGKRTYVPLVY